MSAYRGNTILTVILATLLLCMLTTVRSVKAQLNEDSIVRYAASYQGTTYHYDLYVPKGYNQEPEQEFPVLFIFSPGGNAVLGEMEGWVRAQRWLAVMLVESKNGPWEPIEANFFAAHDDVMQRARIKKKRKFITGMSGGARAASRFSVEQYRPGFHGLFLQGAGAAEIYLNNIIRPDLYVFASFGDQDTNISELAPMQQVMPPNLFKHEIFSGGHVWAPADTAGRALTWLQDQVERNVASPSLSSAPLLVPVNALLLSSKVLFREDMEQVPVGWIATPGSKWQWAQPSCGPLAGFTGTHVLAYNPSGIYTAGMPATYLVTPAIDCSTVKKVELIFQRWLEVERNAYDHAAIEVSGDDGVWHQVWANPAQDLTDIEWTRQAFDISQWVAGHSRVMVRWVMGPTDWSKEFCGWNIDDIVVRGN